MVARWLIEAIKDNERRIMCLWRSDFEREPNFISIFVANETTQIIARNVSGYCEN